MHPLFDVPAAHRAAWPARVPWQLPRCETTLWDNLDITARRYPEKAALVFFGRCFPYAELHREVEKLAGWLLHEARVQHGDRVLVALQNSPQLVIAYLGILRAGAVIVPSNPM
jgi:fatty-acyl-CoA synthase